MRSLNIAATGMLAQQQNVEVISNNIANMNTTGFMRRRTEFQDLIYQNLRRVGSTSSDAGNIVPSGVQLGLGTAARVGISLLGFTPKGFIGKTLFNMFVYQLNSFINTKKTYKKSHSRSIFISKNNFIN